MPGNILEITDLEVGYAGGITGLAGLSLSVPQGQMVALLGANGAGKSTTLKAISNLLPFEGGRVRRGTIRFEGRDITNIPAYRLSRMGLIHVREGRRVFSTMTVHENLVAATYALGTRAPLDLTRRCDDIYRTFPHLERRKNLLAGYLSGGEQQMLAIGRALMSRPRILLLDEPSMGLAPLLVQEIFSIVSEINAGGTTVLLVEQNANMALQVADRGYVLETGRIVLAGTAAELTSTDEVKRAYLGG